MACHWTNDDARSTPKPLLWAQIAVLVGVLLALMVGTASAQVRLGIDGPYGEVTSPVTVCGWALDQAAHPRPGVDVVVDFTTAGQTQRVRATRGLPRPDIAAQFGVQDSNVGWCASAPVVAGGMSSAVVTASALTPTGGSVQRSVTYSPLIWPAYPSPWPASLWTWTNFPKSGQVITGPVSIVGVARDFGGSAIREIRLLTVNRATPDELPVLRGFAYHSLPHAQATWNGHGYMALLTLPAGVYDLHVQAVTLDDQTETRVTRIEVR